MENFFRLAVQIQLFEYGTMKRKNVKYFGDIGIGLIRITGNGKWQFLGSDDATIKW
jgi:hypothetical protein